jgi:heme/copper-type cytochrome/quinol oxidase subunit 2
MSKNSKNNKDNRYFHFNSRILIAMIYNTVYVMKCLIIFVIRKKQYNTQKYYGMDQLTRVYILLIIRSA